MGETSNHWTLRRERRECDILMPVTPRIVFRMLWMSGARFARQEILVNLCLMRAHVWLDRRQRLMRPHVVAQVQCLLLHDQEILLQGRKGIKHCINPLRGYGRQCQGGARCCCGGGCSRCCGGKIPAII